MKKLYPILLKWLAGRIVLPAVVLLMFVTLGLAQAPALSYSGPQNYVVSTAISSLSPSNGGGAVASPGYSNSKTTVFSGTSYGGAIARDAAGDIYTFDYSISNNTRLVKISASPGTPNVVLQSFVQNARDVALDPAGNLFALLGGTVYKISAADGTKTSFTVNNDANGIAVDASGNVYVAYYSTRGYIAEYPAGGGSAVQIGSGLTYDTDVAIDPSGNLYVCDDGTASIIKVAAGTNTQTTVASGFTTFSTSDLSYINCDNAGNIFFTESNGARVTEIATGTSTKIAIGSGYFVPDGIDLDAAGNVYVLDNGTLYEVAPVGGYFIGPALPAGLSFNGTTGTISGTPTALSQATNYSITGWNSSGSSTATVNIVVSNGLSASIISLSKTSAAITSATSVNYSLSFNAAVTGVGASNFSLATSGISGASVGTPSTSDGGLTWTVPVNTGSGDGTLQLKITNAAGLSPAISTTLPFNGDTYTIDKTTPVPQSFLQQDGGTLTSQTQLDYQLIFSEDVTGVDASDFTIVASGVTSDPVSVTRLDGHTYNVSVSNVSGNGTFQINLNSSGTGITDLAGNPVSGGVNGDTFTLDQTAPTVSSITATTPTNTNPTNGTSVIYTVTFSEPVTGVDATDFALVRVGVALSGITVTQVTGSVYTVKLDIIGGNGTLQMNLKGSGTGITDLAGNAIAGGLNGDVYTIDNTRPSVTISAPSAGSASGNGSSQVSYTVTYADANFNTSSLVTAGITLNSSGSASGSLSVTGSGTTYIITVSNITGAGTLGISVAGGYSSDLAGNTDAGTGPSATFNVTSADASLLSINPQHGPLSPAFRPLHFDYNLTVSNGIKTFWVAPVTDDPNATLTVNGATLGSGSQSTPVTLNEGVNTLITIVVTAQDGITVHTYNIHVARAPSSNADLSFMGPNTGRLSPFFSAAVTSYTKTVGYAVSTFTVSPVSFDPNATIKVNGVMVTSGSTSQGISLPAGQTTNVNVVVTAQDGSTNKTYTIAVTRPLSGNATLAALAPSSTPLSPAFAPGINSYSITVPNNKATFTVTPVAADPTATIKVNNSPLASGITSPAIGLSEGATTNVNIVVTAQDGTVNTYTIAVTRQSSANAALTAVGPQYGPLSPVFTPGTTGYTLSLANNKPTFTVTPVTADPNATIMVNGNALVSGSTSTPIALTAGATTNINVVVTAQDGTTTKTYTIAVNRAPGSNDSYADISVSKPAETVTIAEDGIKVHQGISPNGDGIDDVLQIDNISLYPDNHLKIMNRNGQLIFESSGYDNTSKVFDGRSNKNGQMQLPGTYFFQLDYTVNGVVKTKTGYLVLKY